MDFEQISRSLLPLLGGKENIASAAHCATRLRLVLVDDALADQQAIGKIDGVKGCFRNAGQMQIIFGTGVVNKVYAAFIQAAGISESSKSEAADLAAKKLNPFQRIARLLSNIFVPIIPAIVASGLLMGLLGMVKTGLGRPEQRSLYHAGYVQFGGVYHSADPDRLYRRPRIWR